MNATVAPHFTVAIERNISSERSSKKQTLLIGYIFSGQKIVEDTQFSLPCFLSV